jgi:hypothetical protein
MRPFDRAQLADLLARHESPCVTICIPTHGRPPESTQDATRFANAVRDARAQVEALPEGKALMRDARVERIFAQLDSVATGEIESNGVRSFWNVQGRGLAVFAAPGFFAYHRVPLVLREFTQVGDSFDVRQLVPLLTDMRFHVLALSRDEVKIYEGTRDALVEAPMRGVPAKLEEAVGSAWDDSHQGRTFHGAPDGSKGRSGGIGAGVHFHGYGGSDREIDKDLVRFYRAVDRAVGEGFSRPSSMPLVLAASQEHQGAYRTIARDHELLSEGIVAEPHSLSREQLHRAAWALLEPHRRAQVDRALDLVGAGVTHGRASTDASEIAHAAVQGRVSHLVLGEGKHAWGRIDRGTGAVSFAGQREPGSADVLDDLAEIVLLNGGQVLLAPPDRVPGTTGAAAAFRW